MLGRRRIDDNVWQSRSNGSLVKSLMLYSPVEACLDQAASSRTHIGLVLSGRSDEWSCDNGMTPKRINFTLIVIFLSTCQI